MDAFTWFLEVGWVIQIVLVILVPILAYGLGYRALVLTFKILNRVLRTVKVVARGWPPEYLDADGDHWDVAS